MTLTVLKANVLISSDGIPVLTDFGNSFLAERTLQFTQTTNRGNLTVRWAVRNMALEMCDSVRLVFAGS
jgi:hypothetical protein